MDLGRHRIPESSLFHLLAYQQPQQQQLTQSYGGYKEPAAPVSISRCAPGGGGVSICLDWGDPGVREFITAVCICVWADACAHTHTKDKRVEHLPSMQVGVLFPVPCPFPPENNNVLPAFVSPRGQEVTLCCHLEPGLS